LNFTEIIDKVVDITAGCWSGCRQLPGVGEVVVEATTTVGDAELEAEGECHALVEHNAGEVE
jgi:hypothetical protein